MRGWGGQGEGWEVYPPALLYHHFTPAPQGNHQCVERAMHQNCPICFEFLFESVDPTTVLRCGHTIHTQCVRVRALILRTVVHYESAPPAGAEAWSSCYAFERSPTGRLAGTCVSQAGCLPPCPEALLLCLQLPHPRSQRPEFQVLSLQAPQLLLLYLSLVCRSWRPTPMRSAPPAPSAKSRWGTTRRTGERLTARQALYLTLHVMLLLPVLIAAALARNRPAGKDPVEPVAATAAAAPLD